LEGHHAQSELRLVVVSTAVWDALAVVKRGYLPPIYATLRDAMAPEHPRDTSPPATRGKDDHLVLRAVGGQGPLFYAGRRRDPLGRIRGAPG
jgi:hypothetical protein